MERTQRRRRGERKEGVYQVKPYNGQTQLLATPGQADSLADTDTDTQTHTQRHTCSPSPRASAGLHEQGSVRAKSGETQADAEATPRPSTLSPKPTIPHCLSKGSLSRAWRSGPSTRRGKQKSVRRKTSRPVRLTPGRRKGRRQTGREAGSPSVHPSFVTQSPGTGRRKQPPVPDPDTGRRP